MYAIFLFAMLFVTPAKAADADYVFILGARGNPYWEAMTQGIIETAKTKGVTVAIHRLPTETSAEEELNLCQTIAAQKPKMLITEAVNVSVGAQCLKIAQEHDIAYADIDGNFSQEEARKTGLPMAFSVGSDNIKIGGEAARYAASLMKPGEKVAILEGAPGHVNAVKRFKGFKDAFVKLNPENPIVTSVSAQWDRLKANSTTTDWLTKYPDLRLIYAANDMMGLGAAEAVRAAGKEKQVMIVAVDGIKDARMAVLKGRMQATVAQLPYLMGKRAIELATDEVKTGITETIPTPVLTRAVLQANKDPLLQYVR